MFNRENLKGKKMNRFKRKKRSILKEPVLMMWILFAIGIISMLTWKTFGSGPIFQLSEGVMQSKSAKLSYKGFIWKTYEGWIPLGFDSEGMMKKWKYTVANSDKKVVQCIENNSKIKLHYNDYIGIPFRMGQSHQVYRCEPIKD